MGLVAVVVMIRERKKEGGIKMRWWSVGKAFPPMGPQMALASAAGAVSLLAAAVGPAYANDLGLFRTDPREGLVGTIGSVAYSPVVWLIEAAVLNAFIRRGYWWCLLCASVANIASTLVSLVWYWSNLVISGHIFGPSEGGEGWKTAWVYGHWNQFAPLLVRSYLVTVIVEAVVVVLMTLKRTNVLVSVKAVVAMNGLTYALTVALIRIWLAVAPPTASL